MRAIQITEYVSSPSDLTVSTLPTPTPKLDEYLIEIHACALNFYDILQIQGKYQHQPPLPWIAGSEFAGIVLSTPSSDPTPAFPVGSKVFGASQGAFSTHLTCLPSSIRALSPTFTLPTAAPLFITAPTSYHALIHRADLQPGEYILIHAAAGGVGLAAVQIAKAIGAKVIATAGSQEKLDVAKKFGADHGIIYGQGKEWIDEVKNLTPNGRGVNVIFDPVGLVNASLSLIAFSGRIIIVGFAAGQIEKVAMNRVLLKHVSLIGLHWGQVVKEAPGMVEEVWRGLEGLMREGKFGGTRFEDGGTMDRGLEGVGRALEALGGRKTWGKVVLEVEREGGGESEERWERSRL